LLMYLNGMTPKTLLLRSFGVNSPGVRYLPEGTVGFFLAKRVPAPTGNLIEEAEEMG